MSRPFSANPEEYFPPVSSLDESRNDAILIGERTEAMDKARTRTFGLLARDWIDVYNSLYLAMRKDKDKDNGRKHKSAIRT